MIGKDIVCSYPHAWQIQSLSIDLYKRHDIQAESPHFKTIGTLFITSKLS